MDSGNYTCQVHPSSSTCPELESNTLDIQLHNKPYTEPSSNIILVLQISIALTFCVIATVTVMLYIALLCYRRRANNNKNPEHRPLLGKLH